jgi:hypothetical protein
MSVDASEVQWSRQTAPCMMESPLHFEIIDKLPSWAAYRCFVLQHMRYLLFCHVCAAFVPGWTRPTKPAGKAACMPLQLPVTVLLYLGPPCTQ